MKSGATIIMLLTRIAGKPSTNRSAFPRKISCKIRKGSLQAGVNDPTDASPLEIYSGDIEKSSVEQCKRN